MYPRIEDLLKIRDGEPVDARVRSSAAQDPHAQAALNRLKRTAAELRALPELEPPNVWAQVQAAAQRTAERRQRHTRRRRAALAATGAGVALLTVWQLGGRIEAPAPNGSAPVVELAAVPAAELDTLLAESARLERLLYELPRRGHVMSVATAGTIVGLEDRVAAIDEHLTAAAVSGVRPEYRQALWRERVDVMNALVQVRYAQVQAPGN